MPRSTPPPHLPPTPEPNGPAPTPDPEVRRGLLLETVLLLGVSLGASALYAVLAIVRMLTAPVALNAQTSNLNAAVTPDRPWLDLAYQLTGIVVGVAPALLAVYLLGAATPRLAAGFSRARHALGIDLARPGRDLLTGAALAALIGLPGLALYVIARNLGLNTQVSASSLGHAWWSVPVLVLAAVQNAVLEEVVMVGYLYDRWRRAGWPLWVVVAASAIVRGSYHLYQGFGGFAGNIVMAVVFGLLYLRVKRVMPLIVAHTVLDVVAFVGYALLKGHVGWL